MVFSYILGFEPSFLLLVSVFLVALLVVTSWTHVPANAPPPPAGAYPILGHLPHLVGDPRGKMLEWRKKTGDIYSIYMGLTLTVVIGSYDLLKETIIKKAEYFSDKPHPGSVDVLGTDTGIVSTSGQQWKENRSTALSILRSFGMGRNVMGEKIMEEVQAYLGEIACLEGKPVDMKTMTFRTMANVVCNFLIGRRFDYSDSYFDKFVKMTDDVIEQNGCTYLHNLFPWVKHLPGDLFKAKKMIRSEEEYMEFADVFIEKVQREEITSDNLISAYLEEMKRKKDSGQETQLSVKDLRSILRDMIIAGTETVTSTTLWFYLYMIHHPNVQKKVYDEIVREIGTDRPPTAADKVRLNYLSATIMEVQRISSIVPFGLPHLCTKDMPVGGYIIPKDAIIFMHLDAVLLDDKIWGDPWNFRPERFLGEKGELVSPEEFVVFSMGRRVCLGEALAKMELFLLLASVVQRFEALPADPDAKLPPLQDKSGITCPPQPYTLRLVERH